jgi:hypothetical protein
MPNPKPDPKVNGRTGPKPDWTGVRFGSGSGPNPNPDWTVASLYAIYISRHLISQYPIPNKVFELKIVPICINLRLPGALKQ